MEKKIIIKKEKFENQTSVKLPIENESFIDGQNADENAAFEQIEKDLNSKILKITMWINDHHPELSQYLEEMPVTVPSDADPEISLHHLKAYYDSLNSILQKYKLDYPKG